MSSRSQKRPMSRRSQNPSATHLAGPAGAEHTGGHTGGHTEHPAPARPAHAAPAGTAGPPPREKEKDREGRTSRRTSRRTALRAAGVGGGALAAAAAGLGARGAVNGAWTSGSGAPYELWRQWQAAPGLHRLVAAAVLAANPHNIQPWSFRISRDTQEAVDLYADPARTTPLSDPDGRERVAGYGCAIRAMEVTARSQGRQATVEPWPDDDPDHVARITVTTAAPPSKQELGLAAAIPRRHTYRGPFSPRVPDSSLLDSLSDGAPGGARVVWVTQASAMAELSTLYVEATQAIADDEEMSLESWSWFRNDRSDIERHRDGLTLDCQGLSSTTLVLAKIAPGQSRESSDAYWVRTTREVHTATARAWGVIQVDDVEDPRSRLDGGRLLQHVHLAATAVGLGLHHMNQVSERMARDADQGRTDRFSHRWAAATGVPADQSLLAFRVGYPQRSPRPSPRRALDDVLLRGQ